MIDIHNHLMFGVDDGPDKESESVEMLKEAKRQGIKAIILTPHYCHGMFKYPVDVIEERYMLLEEKASNLGIELYLGTEYNVNSNIIEAFRNGRCKTLAGSSYILIEYDIYAEYFYIKSIVQELILNGYIPIIAHLERYENLIKNIEYVGELRNIGALVQINANSIIGIEGYRKKRYCNKLFNKGYIDIIASDSHGINNRKMHMKECYNYITKKFGGDIADKLMNLNQKEILQKI